MEPRSGQTERLRRTDPVFARGPDMRNHGVAHRKRNSATITGSTPAVMPEIDHCIGEGLESVVQLTEAIEAKQQPPELVFPSEHSSNRMESFVEYSGLK